MFPSSPAPAVPSAEHARKLVWITPQCGVIRACYLELGGRQQPPRPRRGEIFCFDKLTTSKDLKISPLFGEAWVTDQLQDTTSSPPRLASSYSVLILTCTILLVPGSAAAPRNTLSLLWKLDRWKIGQSIGYYTKSGEQIFSQEGNTNYKIYIHSSQSSSPGLNLHKCKFHLLWLHICFPTISASLYILLVKLAMLGLPYIFGQFGRKNSSVHLTLSVLTTHVNWQMSWVSEGRMHVAVNCA